MKDPLEDKISTRNKLIKNIVDKNELTDVLSYAEMGSPEAIADRFFRAPPQYGGFSDLAAHKDLVDQVNYEINERLEEAKEEGKDINNWELYESVGRQVRKDALDYADEYENIYHEPGPTQQDAQDQEHREAIEQMRQSRGQDGG